MGLRQANPEVSKHTIQASARASIFKSFARRGGNHPAMRIPLRDNVADEYIRIKIRCLYEL
jgi:hypothetical protein